MRFWVSDSPSTFVMYYSRLSKCVDDHDAIPHGKLKLFYKMDCSEQRKEIKNVVVNREIPKEMFSEKYCFLYYG